LGMTGKHGSNATWSEESMKEASAIHNKVVSFLGEARRFEWSGSGKWGVEERDLREVR